MAIYNKTPEEIRAIVEEHFAKPEYQELFAVPVSDTHIMFRGPNVGLLIVNAKEFGKAMRQAHEDYWKDKP